MVCRVLWNTHVGNTKRCSTIPKSLNMAIKSQNHVVDGCIINMCFSRGIQALVKGWHTCIERGGDYVEK
jgi:hypothetical protein